MPKIVVAYDRHISPEDALLKVHAVVCDGWYSDPYERGMHRYPRITVFENCTVEALRSKTKDSPFRFYVHATEIQKEPERKHENSNRD